MSSQPRSRRLLSLEALEARENPSGNVTATVVGHTLFLVGDDQDNALLIHRDAAGHVVVTGDFSGGTGTETTLVAGNSSSGTVDTTGPTDVFTTTATSAITSVIAILKGGDDSLSTDSPTGTGAFSFSGGFTFDGGDGNNSLDLESTGATDAITLGALVYKGLDGSDSLTIAGTTANPATVKSVVANLANGGGNVSLSDVKTGVIHVAGERNLSAGLFDVTGTGSAGPAVVVAAGNGESTVNVSGATTLGAVVVRSNSYYDVHLNITGGTVTTNSVTLSGQSLSVQVNGSVTWNVNGNIALTGSSEASLQTYGGTTVNVTGSVVERGVASGANVFSSGTKFDVTGAVIVSGPGVSAGFTSSTETKLGSLTLQSGAYGVYLNADDTLSVTGAVRVTAPGGGTNLTLGGSIGGSLLILGGVGDDNLTLNNVTVGGPAVILTGTGADSLNIYGGTTFQKSLFVDQGAGDDSLYIDTSSTNAVTFNGQVTVRQGAGNDTLILDQNDTTPAVFAVSGNLFDGGPGFNVKVGNTNDMNVTVKNYS